MRAVVTEATRREVGRTAQRRITQHLTRALARLQREGLAVAVRGRRVRRRGPARAIPVPRADHETVGLYLDVALP